jgi:hypothetical protein
MAHLFTDDFITDLTAEMNARLAWIARQPIPSPQKLEQEAKGALQAAQEKAAVVQ